jgi:uncharacterized protein YndB with AHSA1/START domain
MNSAVATPAIERSLVLQATPERVWNALTRPEELSKWLGQRADVKLEAGYDGWIEWDGHGRYPLRVVEVEAPRRFTFRWMNEPAEALDPVRATLVEWDLEATASGGTRLHLRESGFDSMAGRAGNAVGWLGELGELVEYVAGEPGDVGVRRSWQLDAPPEVVWRAFDDPDRLAAWWDARVLADRGEQRIEHAEPETYVAWAWTPPGEPADAALQVSAEWGLEPAADDRTELRLLMTGFVGSQGLREAAAYVDDAALPALRRLAEGEARPS